MDSHVDRSVSCCCVDFTLNEYTGRTVFGFGGESLSVAQSAMIAQWFAGKELALALGMNLALARVGSVINDVVSVQVATSYPVYYALWVGFGVCT